MNPIIESLCEDHLYMIRMTYLLDVEVKSLTDISSRSVQKIKILDILQYISDYSHNAHHSLESFLFRRLENYDITPDEKQALHYLDGEHELLGEISRSLEDSVSSYMVGLGSIMDVLNIIGSFKRIQFSHIEREQNIIFPLLMKHLSSDDWKGSEEIAISNKDIWPLLVMRQSLASQHVLTQP